MLWRAMITWGGKRQRDKGQTKQCRTFFSLSFNYTLHFNQILTYQIPPGRGRSHIYNLFICWFLLEVFVYIVFNNPFSCLTHLCSYPKQTMMQLYFILCFAFLFFFFFGGGSCPFRTKVIIALHKFLAFVARSFETILNPSAIPFWRHFTQTR